jgi:hypothetical protein
MAQRRPGERSAVVNRKDVKSLAAKGIPDLMDCLIAVDFEGAPTAQQRLSSLVPATLFPYRQEPGGTAR